MLRAVLALAAVAGLASAEAPIRVSLLETDPPVGSRLKPGEPFYARVQYQSEREIQIWGRGKGTERTPGKSHPSPVYAPGSGEALIWFTLDAPARVEVLRIQALPRGGGAPAAEFEFAVNLRWEDNAPPMPLRAPWVSPMLADLQARLQEHVVESAGTGWNVFATLLFACVPAYLLAQAFAFWRMRGRYGRAFWLPVGAMALLYAVALLGALAGSNLAPVWVVFASPFALIYVMVLLALDFRRASHASGTHR